MLARPQRSRTRTSHQPGSTSPRLMAKRAEVGAAWWLLCKPSPAVIHASHWLLREVVARGWLPQRWPTALTAALGRGKLTGRTAPASKPRREARTMAGRAIAIPRPLKAGVERGRPRRC